jgi:hypothetical protein
VARIRDADGAKWPWPGADPESGGCEYAPVNVFADTKRVSYLQERQGTIYSKLAGAT